jgi:tetratricopeptide (TPR) repeat protein/TolB-like protein
MPDNSNNPFQFWEELKRRKVFRIVAMYAASGFIILELVDIISPALQLPSWTLTLVIVLLAIGFPIVGILSWIFDITPEGLKKTEPARVDMGKDQPEPVKRKLRISELIIVVLVVVVLILVYPRIFKSKASLRAMTVPVTIVDEFGENKTRRVFRENYLTKLVVFPFTNESNDSSENWLHYGIMDAIWHDLVQFNYILCESDSYATYLQEQINHARTNSFPHFLTGDFRIKNGSYEINSRLYQTAGGKLKTERVFRGNNLFSLIDTISLQAMIDLGVSKSILNSVPDLPVSEQLTKNLEAFRYYETGRFVDSFFYNINKAIKLDSTFTHALYMHSSTNHVRHMSDITALKYAKQAMRNRYKLSEIRENLIRTMYYRIHGENNKAIAVAKMQSEMQPYNIRLLSSLISLYGYNFQIHREEKATEQLIKFVPDQPEYKLGLAGSYLFTGKLDKGLKILDKLLKDNPENTDALMQIGELYLHKNDLEAADRAFQKAILLSPENEEKWSRILDHIAYVRNKPITNEFLKSFTGTFRFEDRSEMVLHSFIHNNQLVWKVTNQYAWFRYPISNTEFITPEGDHKHTFVMDDQNKVIKVIHEESGLDFPWIGWKEDSVIFKAKDLLNLGHHSTALAAFQAAYDQNPEHYYLDNYIQHLEFLKSQDYEKLKPAFNNYFGNYGSLELYGKNDLFYFKNDEGFIYKLLPLTKDQFMIPSKLNADIQIVMDQTTVTGLKLVYKDGKEEFYPRSN